MASLDRERLVKLLGMTGSSHDGEALAAVRKAAALVRGAGLSWGDVVGPSVDQPEWSYVERPAPQKPAAPVDDPSDTEPPRPSPPPLSARRRLGERILSRLKAAPWWMPALTAPLWMVAKGVGEGLADESPIGGFFAMGAWLSLALLFVFIGFPLLRALSVAMMAGL